MSAQTGQGLTNDTVIPAFYHLPLVESEPKWLAFCARIKTFVALGQSSHIIYRCLHGGIQLPFTVRKYMHEVDVNHPKEDTKLEVQ